MVDIGQCETGFRFHGRCKLESCQKPFHTNREWQEFCEPAHQQEYWKIIRREAVTMLKKLHVLEEENRRIKERLGME